MSLSHHTKYLTKYAEDEANTVIDFPNVTPYLNTVVIPAYRETDDFFKRFISSKLSTKRVLLIIVINQPVSELCSTTQLKLAQKIKRSGQIIWQNTNLTLIKVSNTQTDVLVIDRFSSCCAIPDKQGVGLARKVGADIATALITKGIILSPWICSTDADTSLPNNYFSVLIEIPIDTSAVIYSFRHQNNSSITTTTSILHATMLYEQSLRYYVSGLKWAGSQYAYHTIGSTLAFKSDAYCMVRGFPKRSAGEDFYLLNKLAKIAPIHKVKDATLLIEPRISDRVPFGTGPAVADIVNLKNSEDYHYYHPSLFIELKTCLHQLDTLWINRDNINHWLSNLPPLTAYGLEQLQFKKLLLHLKQNVTNEHQYNRQILQWFDAFRTLKFIHYLQKKSLPPIKLQEALKIAPFIVN